ncbi:ribokinase [Hypoxylon rubiginosum]|uniref:Ribokinase n=1 Tax=Hypoxylon rubiginosum TaxID=110542 RepID=A0ACC0D692_9PEZI|nr:ribokinase [Hypoxylon rubiginosum]
MTQDMLPLPRITVLGSLNIDIVSYVAYHPQPGETINAQHVSISQGGKGANQAVACVKLSRTSSLSTPTARVSMIGAVGDDSYGPILINSLESFGVDTSRVAVKAGNSGLAIVIVDQLTGENRIVLSPGANYSLLPEHFSTIPGPRPDLLIMQLEIPTSTVLAVLRKAKEARIPVLFNPAPVQQLPLDAYDNLAYLVMNETETCLLSGCAEFDLHEIGGIKRAAGKFIEKGVRNVIFAGQNGKSFLVPAASTKVVDTTAAGDTFIGSLALSIVQSTAGRGIDMEAALRAANKAASKTVSRKGAAVSIPWRDELEDN